MPTYLVQMIDPIHGCRERTTDAEDPTTAAANVARYEAVSGPGSRVVVWELDSARRWDCAVILSALGQEVAPS